MHFVGPGPHDESKKQREHQNRQNADFRFLLVMRRISFGIHCFMAVEPAQWLLPHLHRLVWCVD